MATIKEKLEAAEKKLANRKMMKSEHDSACQDLTDAVTLINKGYSLDDEADNLILVHGESKMVPEKSGS